VDGARRAGRPRTLLDADDDPDPRRRAEPHRPGLRARGGQPGRLAGARVPARDAAALDAGRDLGRPHRLRVDAVGVSHAGAAGRRQGKDDRQRGEGPRPRLLQLAGRRRVRHADAGAHAVPAGRAGPAVRGPRGMILRLAVLALLAFMTLPTVVVIAVSFNPTAILAFPPAGLSLRWYENV